MSRLKLLCWNAQSIMPKLMEVIDYLNNNNIDVAIFTETWLNDKKKLYIPNYNIYRFDRKDSTRGGVAIAISTLIKHNEMSHIKTSVIESIAITVETNTGQIIIAAAYFPGRHINQATITQFKKDIRTLTSFRSSYFVCGDLNAKHRLWNNIRANMAGTALYSEMSNRNFVIEHPPTPTYYPPQARSVHPSTIDIVLTNKLHNISPIATTQSLSSDHLPIEFEINCNHNPLTAKKIPRFDLANWLAYKQHFNSKLNLLNKPKTAAEVDLAIDNFTNILKEATAKAVPLSIVRTSNFSLPNEIKSLITIRNLYRRQWQRSRCPLLFRSIKDHNRNIRSKLFDFKNKMFSDRLESLNPASQQFWKTTKIIKNRINIVPPLNDPVTNQIATSSLEKAELLAKQFQKSHSLTQSLSDTQTTQLVEATMDAFSQSDIDPFTVKLSSPREVRVLIKN